MADIRQPIGGNNDRNSLMVDIGNETYADATAIVGPSGYALNPGADGSLPVSAALPAGGTLVDGVLAATTSGAPLAASLACKGVNVQNDPDNTVDIFTGDPTNQRTQLAPGQTAWYPVSNVNLVYVRTASATGTVPWQAIV